MDDRADDEEDNDARSEEKARTLALELRVNNKKVWVLLDSGASTSFVRRDLVRDVRLEFCSHEVRIADGRLLRPKGKCKVELELVVL